MDREGEGTGRSRSPWSRDAEPEPEWAEAIREGRRVRGDRLREVFATFGDDEPAMRPPRPSGPEAPSRGRADDDEAS